MENVGQSKPPPPARRSGWQQFGRVAALVVAVLMVLYFALSSSAFLKAVVVPRVGESINARLTVSEVSLSPFHRLRLRGLKVETTGSEPVIQAEEVLVRYSLFQLLAGRLALPEASLTGATIHVVQMPDGKSNLDPLLQRTNAVEETTPSKQQINIGRISITRSSLRYSSLAADKSSQVSEISALEMSIENLRNGQNGKLTVSADLAQTMNPTPGSTNRTGKLAAKIDGGFDFVLQENLTPSSIKGNLKLAVSKAEGNLRDLEKLNGQLACEVTPDEVREVALRFDRDAQRLGQVRIRGPIDLGKREGRLTLEIAGIDRHVLNLVGAPFGLDFGNTSLSASGVIDIGQRANAVAATGKGSATGFSVRRMDIATPPIDVQLDYQFNINLNDNSAVVHKFSLVGSAKGQEIVRASLDRSLNLSWGQTIHGLNESVASIAVNSLRLSDWRMFLGSNAPSGTLNATAKLVFQNDGRRIPAEFTLRGQELAGSFGTNPVVRIDRGSAELQASATFTDFRSLLVDQYRFQASEGGVLLLKAAGSAGYDLASQNATLQLSLDTDLPTVLKLYPVPDLKVHSGRASVSALIAREKGQQRLSSKLALTGLGMAYSDFQLTNYEASIETDAEITTKYVTLRRIALSGRKTGTNGGSLDIAGRYDRVLTNGEFSVTILNLNQNFLQPLIASLLAPRQLESIAINGSGSAKYQPASESTFKLDTEISQFLLASPQGSRTPPLDFKLRLDAASSTFDRFDVRNLEIALPPTPKATNTLQFQAKLDLARSNAAPSTVNGFAQALDITPLYDAYASAATTQAANLPTTAQPETEPEPLDLPITTLIANLQVAKLFLHEITVSNIVATSRLNRGILQVDPCAMVVNGAPLTATVTVDLTRSGYAYELAAKTTGLPIELLMSLAPDPSRRVTGNLAGSLQIKGAGITSPNIQKNLSGAFDAGTTNINLEIAKVRSPLLKSVVNVLLALPEVVRRPDMALANVIGSLTGAGTRPSGSWVDDLTASPIDTVLLRGNIGTGRVDLAQAFVQSAAFQADARGTITLAPVLTNSTLQVPVALSLRRALAEKASLVPSGVPTNTAYVRLPDFLTVKGTAGDPKTDINKLALASLTLKAGAGLIGQTGNAGIDAASSIAGAVGNLLGGLTAPKTNAPPTANTNAPGTKPLLPVNPLDLFKRK